MALQKMLSGSGEAIMTPAIIGSLLVLVSSSMPADYSTNLFSDLMKMEKAGLHMSVDMQGMTSESKVWLARIIPAARKKQPDLNNIPSINLNIDSTPFQRLKIKKVPVFLYTFKGKIYRINGAYDMKYVMQSLASNTGQKQMNFLLSPKKKNGTK